MTQSTTPDNSHFVSGHKMATPDNEYGWLDTLLDVVHEQGALHGGKVKYSKDIAKQQIISHIQQHYLSKHHAFTWYITTGLKQNGKVLLGPFATKDLALDVRKYMEIAEAPATYWVEQLHDYGNVQISNKENK